MVTMLGKVWYLWFCNDVHPCLRVRPQLCTYRIRGCDLHTELQGGSYKCTDMHTMYKYTQACIGNVYIYKYIYMCVYNWYQASIVHFSWQSIYDWPRWQGRGVIHIRPQPSTEVVKTYFRTWVCQKIASSVRKLPNYRQSLFSGLDAPRILNILQMGDHYSSLCWYDFLSGRLY